MNSWHIKKKLKLNTQNPITDIKLCETLNNSMILCGSIKKICDNLFNQCHLCSILAIRFQLSEDVRFKSKIIWK